MNKFPIDLDPNTETFLCAWNGHDQVELHTKESLYERYKDTNLYDDEDGEFVQTGAIGHKAYTFQEYLDNSDELLGLQFVCDNMLIARVV